MDPYEVHKKIQEAIQAVEVYKLTSKVSSSIWDDEIVKGLDQLSNMRQTLSPRSNAAGQIRIGKV